jgi:arylsulfatase A-like enzyme
VTIAEVLPAGYFTAMTGKWHVGQNHGVSPRNRGFDRNLNAGGGRLLLRRRRPKAKLFLNGESIANDDPRLPKDWYSTDLWTTFGIKFIDEALAAKKPFYLYLATTRRISRCRHRRTEDREIPRPIQSGWGASCAMPLRAPEAARRHRRRVGEIAASGRGAGLGPDRRRSRTASTRSWPSMPRASSHMDQAVGDLVNGLKQRGVLDNTLILFMSDNGGNAESGPNGRLEGDQPGAVGSTVFCGQSWATLENTPFRRYKHFNHEGGISTPLIVHWPEGFKAKGELRSEPGHLVDIMATVAEVGGAVYPKEFNGHPITPLEGKSLVPAFTGKPIQRDAIFWEHEGNAAVRQGDWKLVRKGGKGAWELYHLKADRTELHDLASAQPGKVKELQAKWEAWAKRAQVLPGPAAFGTDDGTGGGDKAPAQPARKRAPKS